MVSFVCWALRLLLMPAFLVCFPPPSTCLCSVQHRETRRTTQVAKARKSLSATQLCPNQLWHPGQIALPFWRLVLPLAAVTYFPEKFSISVFKVRNPEFGLNQSVSRAMLPPRAWGKICVHWLGCLPCDFTHLWSYGPLFCVFLVSLCLYLLRMHMTAFRVYLDNP